MGMDGCAAMDFRICSRGLIWLFKLGWLVVGISSRSYTVLYLLDGWMNGWIVNLRSEEYHFVPEDVV